jgi:hypothetical protein
MSAKYEYINGRAFSDGPDAKEGEHILRDGLAVADIINGAVRMRPEYKRFGIQAGKFWKEQQTVITGNHIEQGVQVSPNDPGKPMVAQNLKVEPVHTHFPAVSSGFPSGDGNIPPCPPEDPQMGTKTPAVVEWYKRYQPEQWAQMHHGWAGR